MKYVINYYLTIEEKNRHRVSFKEVIDEESKIDPVAHAEHRLIHSKFNFIAYEIIEYI